MTPAQMFETAMLILFSLGWCVSVATMLWTRTPVRKSLLFVALVWTGYLMGICAKLASWWTAGALSPVVWFYVWNAAMILADFVLVVALSRPPPLVQDALAPRLPPSPHRRLRVNARGSTLPRGSVRRGSPAGLS